MSFDNFMSIKDICDKAVAEPGDGAWVMPEIQRPVVWKADQAALLLDSLCRDISIRGIELWELETGTVARVRSCSERTLATSDELLITDGQQRITTLAILASRTKVPDWIDAKHTLVRKLRATVLYDFMSQEFSAHKGALKHRPTTGVITAHDLLTLKLAELEELVRAKMPTGTTAERADSLVELTVNTRKAILGRQVAVVAKRMDLVMAMEAFIRHNTGGTRLRDDEILLAGIAGHCEGLPQDHIRPFIERVAATYGLGKGGGAKKGESHKSLQNAVVRSLITHLQHHAGLDVSTRLTKVNLSGLTADEWRAAWVQVEAAWDRVLSYLAHRGIYADLMPGMNPIVPLVLFALRWEDAFADDRMEALYLLGVRSTRFAKHSTDAHAMDAADILAAADMDTALSSLTAKILDQYRLDYGRSPHFTADELLTYSIKKENRDLFYVAWLNRVGGAQDWKTGQHIEYRKGANRDKAARDIECHHVYPKDRALKDGAKWDASKRQGPHIAIDSVANMALLESATNNAYSNNLPKVTLAGVPTERLEIQLWEAAVNMVDLDSALVAITARAERLAPAMNWFIELLDPSTATQAPELAPDGGASA